MKALIISAVALLVGIVGQGCSSANNAGTARLCTPGAYVICKCVGGDNDGAGTTRCAADGQSFDACSINDSGECPGGEADAGTAPKPVPDPPPEVPEAASAECPGQDTTIQAGVTVQINGDTSTATKDRIGNGSCSASVGANDQVFHLKPPVSGTLKVVVTRKDKDSTIAPIVYLRTICDDVSSQASCGQAGSANGGAQLSRGVAKGRDYYLFIDAASSSKGAYTAAITLTEGPVCGDGIVDSGEACDDGNNNDGDGCSASCRNPSGNPPAAIACPGQDVHLWAKGTVTGTGSNRDPLGANVWANPGSICTSTSTNSTPVHIYRVTPHLTGTLNVDLTGASANLMLVARATCDSAASQLTMPTGKAGCSNDGLSGDPEALTGIPVTNGTPVFIGVKGGATSNNTGDYAIAFRVQ